MHRPLWLQCAAASVNKQVWDVLPYKAVLERPAVAQPKRAKPADALPSPTDDDPWAAQPVRIPSLGAWAGGTAASAYCGVGSGGRCSVWTGTDRRATAEGFGFRRRGCPTGGQRAVCRVRAAAGSRLGCAQRAAASPSLRLRYGDVHRGWSPRDQHGEVRPSRHRRFDQPGTHSGMLLSATDISCRQIAERYNILWIP